MDERRKALRESLQEYSGPEHADHVAELHAELDREEPRPAILAAHVERLSEQPGLEFKIASWWNDPKTQAIIADLNAMGI